MSDEIVKRRPINRTAANVVRKGEHFTANKQVEPGHSENRPHQREALSGIDLTGARFGAFTVLGLSKVRKRWDVRCDCGLYEVRTAKAIRNPRNHLDCCGQCHHIRFLADRSEFNRTGRNASRDARLDIEASR